MLNYLFMICLMILWFVVLYIYKGISSSDIGIIGLDENKIIRIKLWES